MKRGNNLNDQAQLTVYIAIIATKSCNKRCNQIKFNYFKYDQGKVHCDLKCFQIGIPINSLVFAIGAFGLWSVPFLIFTQLLQFNFKHVF